MSRRIATDQGGHRGPKSSRDGRQRNDRHREDDRRYDNDRPGSSNGNNMMTQFPFQFPTLPNGMPMLPPGFAFPFPPNNGNQ